MIPCPHCGADLPAEYTVARTYRHTLNPGLVSALRKFARAVGRNGRNEIHLLKDMQGDIKLTPHEWNNFTKLRFFALVAKVRKDGKHKVGYWLLTRRGSQFLKGEASVPESVTTRNNHVTGHGTAVAWVKPFFNQPIAFETFAFEIGEDESFIAPRQARLALAA